MFLYSCSIRCIRCEAGARCLAGCTVAKCLHEARARGSRVLFVLVVSIAMFRLRSFLTKHLGRGSVTKHLSRSIADEKKKKKHLSRSIADEKKKKKHSVEYFFLNVCRRDRQNPLAQTSAVADTIGCTAGCIAVVDRNENVAGCNHADVTLIENIGVTVFILLHKTY